MSHVTESQRYTIAMMIEQGYRQKEISEVIGKDKSVVSREISRNCDMRSGKYNSKLAQNKYEKRKREKPKEKKFTKEVQYYIEEKLRLQWSPEQISNSCDTNKIKMVSTERIYQHIIQDKKTGGVLYENLRRKKKYRKRIGIAERRGKLKNRLSIHERPKEVDQKTRVGDFEVDLILGANHKGALLTINDRKTGLAKVRLLKSKNAKGVAKAIVKALKGIKEICKTMTSDNGKEFAQHEYVSKKLGLDFYFADPYSSWQRGANENLNGLIRQYFPKKSSFEQLTWRDIKKVENLLNNRPRKRLGYNTPQNKFDFLTKVAFVA